ncbi:MAG: FkbM family methyltransferase [Limisphaerales bacterium]
MKRIMSVANENRESLLVWQFFGCTRQGFFVEVGANHPTELNQTWFLEQQGWSGILVEPNPDLCELLLTQRPRSRTFQVAVGHAEQVGEVELLLGESHVPSTLKPLLGDPLSGVKIRVLLRTLDSILVEAGAERIDFLSIDVEGMELAVLQGFNLEKYVPRLILLEEQRRDFKKHFYLRRHGYRLVKRTGLNNWYVPAASPATARSLNTTAECWRLFRKMWLNAPFDNGYRKLKQLIRGNSATHQSKS